MDPLNLVLSLLDTKKAEDIVSYPTQGRSPFGEHVVIASGTSGRHIHAIADHLSRELKNEGLDVYREGIPGSEWILMNSGGILIHLFKPEARDYYEIEKLWQHGPSSGIDFE